MKGFVAFALVLKVHTHAFASLYLALFQVGGKIKANFLVFLLKVDEEFCDLIGEFSFYSTAA